jgi:epsilon-lactone hydrolase
VAAPGVEAVLHVPARDVPVPPSVSPEARAALSQPRIVAAPYPELDDLDGWRAIIAEVDQAILDLWSDTSAEVEVEDTVVEGVPVYVAAPHGPAGGDRRVYLDVHGGALVMGAGAVCRALAAAAAPRIGARLWSIDYRMPPDHPYPAALDDCVAVYRALLEDRRPEEIVVGGVSAGGNLAAALVLRARDEGLPLPAGLVLHTPEVDLTESGDSFRTNLGVDTTLPRSLMPANLLYAGGHDLTDPYISPLFGDFTKGFPPTLLTAGTRDLFLSNTVRMHRALRAAGVPAELHLLEAAPHGGFFRTSPEERELEAEVRRFLDERWAACR